MNTSRKPSTEELKSLAGNVARLSRLLTRDRDHLPAAYLKDAGLREAYRTYFLLPNMKKVLAPLRELTLNPAAFPPKDRLRVLDLGSGPGTALLGALEFFAAQEYKPVLQCTAVDQVAENLSVAEELFAAQRDSLRMSATLATVRADIEDSINVKTDPVDLIILSNILNELFVREGRHIEKRLVALEQLLARRLAHDGSCIIIEPALRETSRDLLHVRDGLLRQGFTIYSPCLCRTACPALLNPRDWCHEDIPWDPPAVIGEIDRLTGLRKDSLKFSYLVVRKDGLTSAETGDETVFRIVSEPLVTKGKIEFFVCGRQGRRLTTRLDKDASARNGRFKELHRGDVVGFEQLIDEGKRCKIGKETAVAIRRRSK